MRKFLEPDPVHTGVGKWRIALFNALFSCTEIALFLFVLFPVETFQRVKAMWVAISKQTITPELIKQYAAIEPVIDQLILRTRPKEQVKAIEALLKNDFPKDKITVHSDIEVLNRFNLTHIHFKEMDERAFHLKQTHPDLCVSMSTHSQASAQAAKRHHLDYVLFGHLFETASKPGLPPRTQEEIDSVLTVDIPVIALGGINFDTLSEVPQGFSGIAAISLFAHHDLHTLSSLKEGE